MKNSEAVCFGVFASMILKDIKNYEKCLRLPLR